MNVVGDVAIVVVVNERVAVDGVIQRECRYYQQETQNDVALFGDAKRLAAFSGGFLAGVGNQEI